MLTPQADIIIVGAGIAGLSCAHHARKAHKTTHILERSRRAGGRCATRNIGGYLADHGTPYLHGKDQAFVELLRRMPATARPWPKVVEGLAPADLDLAAMPERRPLAVEQGINAFAQGLASDTQVQIQANVSALFTQDAGLITLAIEGGTQVAGFMRRAGTRARAKPRARRSPCR